MRVLIVDNQALFRDGLAELLQQRQWEVVAVAEEARQGVVLALQLKPDLVLLDVRMPGLDGIDCCRILTRRCPETRVLALSGHSDWHFVQAMLEAGAAGYALKDSGLSHLLTAMEAVCRGDMAIDPNLGPIPFPEDQPHTPYVSLSQRERQVAKLLAEGHTNAEVADLLNISVKTVETHRSRLFTKLGVKNLADLIRLAVRAGWIEI